jgi:hypothetical protein
MKIIRYLLIYSLIFIYGCTPNKFKQDKTTRIFSNYINKEFNIQLDEKLHYFILLPKFGCHGCIKESIGELNNIITETNKNNIIIITTNLDEFSDSLKSRIKILVDTSGKLDNLNLPIANLTLVESQDEKVNYIKSINTLENGVSLSSLIKIH